MSGIPSERSCSCSASFTAFLTEPVIDASEARQKRSIPAT